jgi:hypothetical protein
VTGERMLILAERRMEPELAAQVQQACAFTGVEWRAWNGRERLDGLAGRAALVIGVLPAGERRIPGDLAWLVTEQLPGLPLVLLAEEPLIRPLVSLEGGRVTLLEAPLSPALLASCARTLLAEAVPGEAGWWPVAAAEGPAVDRREFRVGASWVGVLDCNGPADWSGRPTPWLCTGGAGGVMLAATLAFADGEGRPTRASDSGTQAEGTVSLFELHGAGPGSRWVFPPRPGEAAGEPGEGESVALFSAARVPTFSAIAQVRGAGAAVQLAAAQGDLVVSWCAGPEWLERVRHGAPQGGPALLDALEAELQREPSKFSCVVVELS